jgi:hypothetical protein
MQYWVVNGDAHQLESEAYLNNCPGRMVGVSRILNGGTVSDPIRIVLKGSWQVHPAYTDCSAEQHCIIRRSWK